MREKYDINITLRFLYFHITFMSTCIMHQHNYTLYALSLRYVPLIIYVVFVKIN